MKRMAQMSEIQTSEIRTKFRLVFQTERSDFGHLLYNILALKKNLASKNWTGPVV